MPNSSFRILPDQRRDGSLWACPLWLILFLWIAVAPFAASAQRFQVHLYDEADGLANLTITAFAQQADGHLWIATENGLFRYDGSVFTEFGRADGLMDKSAYSLHIDHTGTLWAGSHGGLFYFDGHGFHEVKLGGKSVRVGVNSMLASTAAGELIVETSTGLLSVERDADGPNSTHDGWTAVTYPRRHPTVTHYEDTDGITVDASDRLWFGCSAKLCVFDGKTVQVFGPDRGVPNDFYVSLFVARDGRLWARGRKHILTWRYGDARMREVTETFPAGGILTLNRRFAEDSSGKILTPTAKGFAAWHGGQWTETLSTSAGPLDGATDLLSDREGSLWIGTDGSGLLHALGYGLWQNFGSAEGLSGTDVAVIAADKAGKLWIGHNLGGNLLTPATGLIGPGPLAKEKDVAAVEGLAPDPEGGMWVATILGHIFHVNPKGAVDRRFEVDSYIHCIGLDGHGTLWIATSTGLFTLDSHREPQKLVRFPDAALGEAGIGDIRFAADGSLWIASRHGLTRIDFRHDTPSVTNFAVPGQPDGIKLLCLGADGTFWVAGSVPGVFRIRIQGQTATVVESLNRPQLASDRIFFLGRDSSGSLWIGTDHGVNVFSGGRLLRLTDDDGLLWNDCGGGFLAQNDGSVWIGTSKGLSHLLNPAAALHRAAFPVTVEDARYGTHQIQSGTKAGWTDSTLSVRFSALTFRDNRQMVYHSQLIGFDSAETASSIPSASYPKLPPGDYTFRVYAEDPGKGVVSAPAQLQLVVTPPWWRTLWFGCLVALLFFGLIAALWYALHQALLAQRRKLQLMVRERTVELEQMAMRDSLTGLLNRRALFDALGAELEAASRRQSELCVAIIDLDHFKRINDTYGHLAGDEVLRQTAQRLAASSRNSDIVGRYGGEEFLVIFRDAKSSLGIERCELMRQAVSAQPVRYQGHDLSVTCSIGLAWTRSLDQPANQLLAEADSALYSAKSKGRNLVEHPHHSAELLSKT